MRKLHININIHIETSVASLTENKKHMRVDLCIRHGLRHSIDKRQVQQRTGSQDVNWGQT